VVTEVTTPLKRIACEGESARERYSFGRMLR